MQDKSKNYYQDVLEQLEIDVASPWVTVKNSNRKEVESRYCINRISKILLENYVYKNDNERPNAITAFVEASEATQTQCRLQIPKFLLRYGIPDKNYLHLLFKDHKVKGWSMSRKELLKGPAISNLFNKLAYLKKYENCNLFLERLLSLLKESSFKNSRSQNQLHFFNGSASSDEKWNKLVDFVTDLENNNGSKLLQKIVTASSMIATPSFVFFALKEIGIPKELTNQIGLNLII